MRMRFASRKASILFVACLAVVICPLPMLSALTMAPTPEPINESDDFPVREQSRSDRNESNLLTACPEPADEVLDGTCLQALDQYFLNKAFGYQVQYFQRERKGDPVKRWLEYGRIFADPARDQMLVFATLDREDCFSRRIRPFELLGTRRPQYQGVVSRTSLY